MDSTKGLMIAVLTIAVALLLLFTLPRLLDPEPEVEESYTFNYFEFYKTDGVWYSQAKVNDKLVRISLRNGPKDLVTIPVEGDIRSFGKNSFFYIAFDPSEEVHNKYVTMANAELSTNLVSHFNKRLLPACTVEHPDCESTNTTVLTCESTQLPMIYLDQGGMPGINIEGNCATISGTDDDLVRAADRFMYAMYGIM